MKKTKILAFILIIVMIAASAMFIACKKDEGGSKDENVLGTGATSFKLEITGLDGETKTFTVKTDEATVGDALIKINYIPANSKDAGYFETLNGVKTDYMADGSYWAFYVNGEYWLSGGAFDVNVEKDAVYSFKYEIDQGDWEPIEDDDLPKG